MKVDKQTVSFSIAHLEKVKADLSHIIDDIKKANLSELQKIAGDHEKVKKELEDIKIKYSREKAKNELLEKDKTKIRKSRKVFDLIKDGLSKMPCLFDGETCLEMKKGATEEDTEPCPFCSLRVEMGLTEPDDTPPNLP